MKKILLFLAAAIFIIGLVIKNNSDPRAIISALEKKDAIKPSGNLIYRIYLLGIFPVGEAVIKQAELSDYSGLNTYHLSAQAKTAQYFSKLFSAYAQIDSFINTQDLNPIAFKQVTEITNKGKSIKEVSYDQKTNIMTISGVRRQIMPNTQDPLSAIYHLREIDFNTVKDFKVSLNTNQKNYLLEGKAVISDLKLKGKIFKLIAAKTEIKRGDGNPHHKSTVTFYMLADYKNTPVLIKVSASGAIITAKLVRIE